MLTAIIALAVIAADQVTKWAAIDMLSAEPGGKIVVIERFFAFTLVYNPGAAFGILPRFNHLFVILSILTVAALLFFFRSFFAGTRTSRVAAGLILGGAVGNLIDRFRFRQVVDFFDFQFGEYHWPAFNIADSAICVGVALLIAAVLFGKAGRFPATVSGE
ncbi:MAG: signal peptidase II [Candidatus Erginobacter occultus]|nr:signal peptidase II [Candidatus Erginobacter occultus]